MRFAAKAEITPEEHTSTLVFGDGTRGIPTADYGRPAVEVLDAALEPTLDDDALERLRIEAGTPAWGKEIDDRVLPAEAGLVERAVSLTKGCYPGQEPIARLHYRGHANRGLRVLRRRGRRASGAGGGAQERRRRWSGGSRAPCRGPDGIVALAYVRAEVPDGRRARPRLDDSQTATLTAPSAPVAQGIERCPAEAEVARSNRAGRITETSRS